MKGSGMEGGNGARRRKPNGLTPWQRRRRRSLGIVAILVLLLSTWFLWRMGKRAALNEALHEMAALGVVDTVAEYESKFGPFISLWSGEVVPSESPYRAVVDAYVPATQDAYAALPRFNANYVDESLVAVPYDDTLITVFQGYVGPNKEVLVLLHDILQTEAVLPVNNTFVGEQISLLCAAACLAANTGDVGGAVRALEDGLLLIRGGAAVVQEYNPVIAQNNQVERVLVALGSILRRVNLSTDQLLSLQRHFTTENWVAQRVERDIKLQSNYLIVNGNSLQHEGVPINILTGNIDQYRAWDYRAWCIRLGLIGRSLEEQKDIMNNYSGETVMEFLYIEPHHVLLDVTRAGFDVLRWVNEHGALPESLNELVPDYWDAVPEDFWGDGPLRYHVDGPKFLLYSVGRDEKDDDGDLRQDIVFGTAPLAGVQ